MNFLSFKKSKKVKDDKQQCNISLIENTFDSLKLQLFEKLDEIKQQSFQLVLNKETNRAEPPALNLETLSRFEQLLNKAINKLAIESFSCFKTFDPFVFKEIEVSGNIGFNYGANVYDQNYNLIISCPSNGYLHVLDGDKFTPAKNKKKKLLKGSVVQMSHCQETDSYLLACSGGEIYSYSLSGHKPKMIMKQGDNFALAIVHLDSTTFAFSCAKSGKLYIATTDGKVKVEYNLKENDAWYLYYQKKNKLLLAALSNGQIIVYKVLPDKSLSIIETIQAHKVGKYVTIITSATVNNHEYILTGGNDQTIKMWNFYQGKMKLLKVISLCENVSNIVYLENYKMIATTHHKGFVKFFNMPSGTLSTKLDLNISKVRSIFLMKDKNMLGVGDLNQNILNIIQLHEKGREDEK